MSRLRLPIRACPMPNAAGQATNVPGLVARTEASACCRVPPESPLLDLDHTARRRRAPRTIAVSAARLQSRQREHDNRFFTRVEATRWVGWMAISERESLTWPLVTNLQPAAINAPPERAADNASEILRKLSLVCPGGSTLQRGPPGNPRFVDPSCLYVQIQQWRRSTRGRCRDATGRHGLTTSQIPALQCR